MPYKILPTREFEKDFKRLDKFLQERIIRIGKLRILFSYNKDLNELYLEKIIFGHNY